jgi:hypothetical protein
MLYSRMLGRPAQDKIAFEYLLARAATSVPVPSKKPDDLVMPPSHYTKVREGFIPEIIIVRPALLVGGDAPAKGPGVIRSGEDISTHTIRRSDVGLFIATQCLPPNEQWVNKKPVIGY